MLGAMWGMYVAAERYKVTSDHTFREPLQAS
jgi:hypothetical protein